MRSIRIKTPSTPKTPGSTGKSSAPTRMPTSARPSSSGATPPASSTPPRASLPKAGNPTASVGGKFGKIKVSNQTGINNGSGNQIQTQNVGSGNVTINYNGPAATPSAPSGSPTSGPKPPAPSANPAAGPTSGAKAPTSVTSPGVSPPKAKNPTASVETKFGKIKVSNQTGINNGSGNQIQVQNSGSGNVTINYSSPAAANGADAKGKSMDWGAFAKELTKGAKDISDAGLRVLEKSYDGAVKTASK